MKLAGGKVYARFLEEADAESMLALQLRNQDFFERYVSSRNDDFYTFDQQLEGIKKSLKGKEQDQSYSFGIFEQGTDKLVGNVSLTEVLRGPLQSCFIGYYLDQQCNGKGYMTEAVRLVVDYAFRELKLHRIEAGVMPHNIRSMRVLEKAGFDKEGIARKSVHINGKWEDHQILAIVNGED